MRIEEVQRSLERLKASCTDIEGVVLVSQEGFIVASILPPNIEEDRVSALSAAFLGLAERCAEELGKVHPRQLYIQTDQGYIVTMGVGPDANVTVLTNRFAKPGLVLLDMRKTSEEIRALL
jgi:hypothetical protein